MDVSFADDDLERLFTDAQYSGGYSKALVRSFRQKVQFILAASDERDLRQWKSLHYEQLKGKRKHQCSIRLNKQWRLILEKQVEGDATRLVIVAIEDYH